MVTSFKARVFIFFIFNLMLLLFLYSIPVDSKILENVCLFKQISGKTCFNCGMTRACLSILHFDFNTAYKFNHNVVIVFPFTVGIYLYSWSKYIFNRRLKNE